MQDVLGINLFHHNDLAILDHKTSGLRSVTALEVKYLAFDSLAVDATDAYRRKILAFGLEVLHYNIYVVCIHFEYNLNLNNLINIVAQIYVVSDKSESIGFYE